MLDEPPLNVGEAALRTFQREGPLKLERLIELSGNAEEVSFDESIYVYREMLIDKFTRKGQFNKQRGHFEGIVR